jgi:hypothetical protein
MLVITGCSQVKVFLAFRTNFKERGREFLNDDDRKEAAEKNYPAKSFVFVVELVEELMTCDHGIHFSSFT